MIELFAGACHYCGIDTPTNHRVDRNGSSFKYNGIDRVDNNRGYTPDNVVTACSFCNLAKREMTRDEFITWARRLVAHSEGSSS